VIFLHEAKSNGKSRNSTYTFVDEKTSVKPWEEYANNPLRRNSTRKLTPEFRGYLEKELPEYMIPAAFVTVQEFPLTPNGKLDRGALPSPDGDRPASKENFVPPGDPVEEAVAGIWSKLLDVGRIGVKDNFFEFGGHSLLAVQLITRIRDTFQVDLPLRALLDAPTIRQLSSVIRSNETIEGRTEKIAGILQRVESMSDEEIGKTLEQHGHAREFV
jgi:acyl carrier protein